MVKEKEECGVNGEGGEMDLRQNVNKVRDIEKDFFYQGFP